MPRPSVKEARRTQILDAAEICVAHFGVEGLTLERVAEEADLARALIRHNVGNKEDLVDALTERYLAVSRAEMDDLFQALPASGKAHTMIDWLFDPAHSDPMSVLVADALVTYGAKHRETARKMRHWTEKTWRDIAKILEEEFPDCDQDKIDAAAAGLLGLFFNAESSTSMGPMTSYREATKQAATMLIDALKS